MRTQLLLAAALLAPGLLRSQTVAQRVARAPDGAVRLSFAAREGVCGNGSNINISDDHDQQWKSDCEHGPVRVSFRKAGSALSDMKVRVGGQWRSDAPAATDLGLVPAREAADYLLGVATGGSAEGDQAIMGAQLADSSVVWPRLLDMAKKKGLPDKTRQSAVFWVSQAAGDQVVKAMGDIAADASEDRELRQAAVFGLSRRPADEGVPALIRLSASDRDPEIRRQAMFWLAQSKDERALAWFEKVLTSR
jgi:hypothetical protein